MSHTVTAKLNNDARQHQGQSGMTFFVSLGEKNYNFKTKENAWTNYDAAIFAKDGQVQFYSDSLKKGAIVTVTGTGIIIDHEDKQYAPKLQIQDAKITFINFDGGQPQNSSQGFSQQAPQQQGGFSGQQQGHGGFSQQQAPQQQQQAPQQQSYNNQPQTQQGGYPQGK